MVNNPNVTVAKYPRCWIRDVGRLAEKYRRKKSPKIGNPITKTPLAIMCASNI